MFDTSRHAKGRFSPVLNLPSDWMQVHVPNVLRRTFRFVRFNVKINKKDFILFF